MAEEYEYSGTLGPRSIRLLELQPGHIDDPIDVSLSTAELSDKLQYEALSYEWGTVGKSESIRCISKKIAVTRNLMIALQHIRREHQSRTLWVDAICINQEDASERSEQVSLMSKIFSQARQVVVWLGPGDHHTNNAFDMFYTLAKLWVSREVKKAREGELRRMSWNEIPEEEAPYLEIGNKSLWDAIYAIFERTYFGRVWVIQEIAVATRARVLCGNEETNWRLFSWAAAYVGCSNFHLHQCPSDMGVALITMIQTLTDIHQNKAPVSLNLLYRAVQPSKATDGRDKVFGVLGLLNPRNSKAKPCLNKLLAVDYSLTIPTVYSRAAKGSILEHQDLRICHAQIGPSQLEGLPSWAPDWSNKSGELPFVPFIPRHCIGKHIGGKISFVSDAMHINGCLVDTIVWVSSKLSCEDPLEDIQDIMVLLSRRKTAAQISGNNKSPMSCLGLEKVVARLKRKIYQGQESMYEALWRTLIANTAKFLIVPPEFRRHFDAIVDHLRLRARGVFLKRSRVCDETTMDKESRQRLVKDCWAQLLCRLIHIQKDHPYFCELANTIHGRVFFVTKNGYIGICAPGATVGDQIAILKGGWQPFVLRQHNSFFEMKGDAYVHGIWDAKSCNRFMARSQRFEIR